MCMLQSKLQGVKWWDGPLLFPSFNFYINDMSISIHTEYKRLLYDDIIPCHNDYMLSKESTFSYLGIFAGGAQLLVTAADVT